MLVSVAAAAVKLMEPVMDPAVAAIVAVPAAVAVTRPEALARTTDGVLEVQLTAASSCVLPSLNVPMAASCWLVPTAIVLCGAAIARDTRDAGRTFTTAVSDTVPTLAVRVAVPADIAVTMPSLLTAATVAEEELQVVPPQLEMEKAFLR
jgi:hypothetical protein